MKVEEQFNNNQKQNIIIQNLVNCKLKNLQFLKDGFKISYNNHSRFQKNYNKNSQDDLIQEDNLNNNFFNNSRPAFVKGNNGWTKKLQIGGTINPDIFVNYKYSSLPETEFDTDIPFTSGTFASESIPQQKTEIKKDPVNNHTSSIDWNSYVQKESEVTENNSENSSEELKSSTDDLIKGNQTAEYVYKGLIKRGLSKESAAAATVCFNYESGFKTNVVAKPSQRGSKTYSGGDTGLAQWTGSRKAEFEKLFNKPLTQATLDEQLDYVVYEINKMPKLKEALDKSKSFKESLDYFIRGYEGGYDNPYQTDAQFYGVFQESVAKATEARLKKASKFLNV